MIIYFSFDDGRGDFYYNVYPVLKQNELVASVHITTGFVDGTFCNSIFGEGRKPLLVSQLRELSDYGIDISSHGDKHVMKDDDFNISRQKMIEWNLCHANDKIGFSIPNSKYNDSDLLSFVNNNNSFLKYVRVGRNPICYNFFNKIHYGIYHYLFRNKHSYYLFNKYNIIEDSKIDRQRIFCIVVKKDCRLKHMIYLLNKYIEKNVHIVFMFHSIVEKPNNDWEWAKSNFVELIDYCVNNKIIIRRLSDL